jgi:hypothetical protein
MTHETVIFKHDLRAVGLPVEDVDGLEQEAVLIDQDELDWYVLEVLEPEEVKPFLQLLALSWFPVGSVSRINPDSDDDDNYSKDFSSQKYQFSDHFYKENPSYYSEHFS